LGENTLIVSQGLSVPCPNLSDRSAHENAVAGVGSRNGAKKIGLRAKTELRNRAERPLLASALTAVLDREGRMLAIVVGPLAVRRFLREATR